MGVVLLARDVRLERRVALKALPAHVLDDAEHLARFEREARLLAALHHPNVASLHGLEEVEERRFLVMEYVRGETLADRLGGRRLDLDEALDLAAQIARGVAAAHDAGIIHRDLKPGNVMVTVDGRAKVVDFGLAKSVSAVNGGSSGPGSDDSAAASSIPPTVEMLTAQATAVEPQNPGVTTPGMVMGTAAYMSPEQARGRALDRRTDVWAFGCVLFECVTGRRAFHGETLAQVLTAVLEKEPDWSYLPATTPPPLRLLLERCLRKDPKRRLRDLSDVELELSELLTPSGRWSAEALAGTSGSSLPELGSSPQRGWLFAAAGLIFGALVVLAWVWAKPKDVGDLGNLHLSAQLSADTSLETEDNHSLALSPDGRSFVASVDSDDGGSFLVRRSFEDFSIDPLDGSEGASGPFFSPDGAWIAFVVPEESVLKKLPAGGGNPETLATIDPSSKGGTWLEDGTMVVAGGYARGLHRISAAGGEWEVLTEPKRERGEKTHRFPQSLPGGRWLIYTASDSDIDSFDEARIDLLDLKTLETRTLIDGGSDARWSPSGHVVYARKGGLSAAPFDLAAGKLTGPPRSILHSVVSSPQNGCAQYDIGPDGTLAFAPGSDEFRLTRLVSIGPDREIDSLDLAPDAFELIRVAPDGRFAVVQLHSASTDLWLFDRGRGTLSRLTRTWDNTSPVWTPEGQIIFSSTRGAKDVKGLTLLDLEGGEPQSLGGPEIAKPLAYVPQGRYLIAAIPDENNVTDIVAVPIDGGEHVELVATSAAEIAAAISPDGRHLAYASNISGQFEVYVEGFMRPTRRLQVSVAGGRDPLWRQDGQRLIFRRGRELLEVTIDADKGEIGEPLPLAELDLASIGSPVRTYDLTLEGEILVPVIESEPSKVREIRLVFDWRPAS